MDEVQTYHGDYIWCSKCNQWVAANQEHYCVQREVWAQEVKDAFDNGVLALKRDLKKRAAAIKKQYAADMADAFQAYDEGKAALWQIRQRQLAELGEKELDKEE